MGIFAHAGWGEYDGVAYQVIENTLVQLPLGRAALPELLISVVETLPVLAELGETVGVDVGESIASCQPFLVQV